MRPENINTVCHRWILEIISQNDICVDMTMGNGNDTLFLAQNSNYVYSFDIQEKALENTRILTKDYQNISLIKDSHENVDKYVKEAEIFVFNLGYLPNGDEKITTKTETTMIAIKKALEIAKKAVFVVFYIGHDEGYKEYQTFLNNRINCEIVRSYTYIDRANAPILYELRKKD